MEGLVELLRRRRLGLDIACFLHQDRVFLHQDRVFLHQDRVLLHQDRVLYTSTEWKDWWSS